MSKESISHFNFMSRKVLVLGGTGYIGREVCATAVAIPNVQVTAIARSFPTYPLPSGVNFLQADVSDIGVLRSLFEGAFSVISCIGAFGSQQSMLLTNGTVNANAVLPAKQCGVKFFGFVSAADMPSFIMSGILKGYFDGKRLAESTIKEHFPETHVIVRPGFVFGTRSMYGVPIPLQVLGFPLQWISWYISPLSSLIGTPVSVKVVAHSLTYHLRSETGLVDEYTGILDVSKMESLSRK